MKRIRLVLVLTAIVLLCACSKSGRGTGATDDLGGAGEGNIPLAEPGSELKDVNFDFDSSSLGAGEQARLRENSRWLLDNPAKSVVVEGHCDERGTIEYNLALGERRARSAYDFLRSLGVKNAQMKTVSYGKELPLDPGHSEAAWAKNRRAHFSMAK